MHVDKFNFKGDSNVGLYAVATDKFVLVGKGLGSAKVRKLEKIFKVPVIQISVYSTDLIGVFICANSNAILVPEVIYPEELKDLKEKTKGLATVKVVKTELNALGNNILTNDKIAIFNDEMPTSMVKDVAKALGVKTKSGLKNIYPMLPGAAACITNRGGIFPTDLPESEVAKVEKLLGFEIGLGTMSMGGKMLGSSLVANSNGFIYNASSSGYEVARADESLGFLK